MCAIGKQPEVLGIGVVLQGRRCERINAMHLPKAFTRQRIGAHDAALSCAITHYET